MTKSELSEALAEKSGSTRATAELVVNTIFETIMAGLGAGAKVEVRGFGSFRVKLYDGYEGRNPATGAPVRVAAKRVPTFRQSKKMTDRLNRH